MSDDTHDKEARFLAATGDAVDNLLAAKDLAKQLGYSVEATISALIGVIHAMQNDNVPNFGDG